MNTNRIPVPKTPVRTLSLDSRTYLFKSLDCENRCLLQVDKNVFCCLLANEIDQEWPRRLSLCMSPSQWMTHVQLLRSFSRCAAEASDVVPVVVPEHRSACLTRGSRGSKNKNTNKKKYIYWLRCLFLP